MTKKEKKDFVFYLPPEIFCLALSFLDIKDLLTCTKVSRFWCKYAKHDDAWKRVLPDIHVSRYKNYRKVMRIWFDPHVKKVVRLGTKISIPTFGTRYVKDHIFILTAKILRVEGKPLLNVIDKIHNYPFHLDHYIVRRRRLMKALSYLNKKYKIPDVLIQEIVRQIEINAREIQCSFGRCLNPIDKRLGTCPKHYQRHIFKGCYGRRCHFCSRSSFE